MRRIMLSACWLGLLLGLLGLVGLSGLASAFAATSAETEDLLCPGGATTLLRGTGEPNTPLIAFFDERAVGGGLVDREGNWEIPLTISEPPGVYPVEVRVRGTNEVVQRFRCFVDPERITPTATNATNGDPTASSSPAAKASPSPSPTRTATATATATVPAAGRTATTPPAASSSPTSTASATSTGTATSTATATATGTTTSTPTRTATATTTPTEGPVEVEITDLGGPLDENELGFIVLENVSDNDAQLAGWKIRTNRAGLPMYTFGNLLLRSGETLVLYVGTGLDNPPEKIFYWQQTSAVWQSGDTVALLNAQNSEQSSVVVP
jgi:hypothetical protein